MDSKLIQHIAELAEKLETTVYYEYTLTIDSPTDSYPSLRERHSLTTTEFKSIHRMTLESIMLITKDNFIIKGE